MKSVCCFGCRRVSLCVCVCTGTDEFVSFQSRGWCDCWQAPSRPAESCNSLCALPAAPPHPISWFPLPLPPSSAPHICCVLATDSKLQPPGPLPDSLPTPSHVPLLTPSPQRAINSPSRRPSVRLPPFLSFWSVFLSPCLSYSSWLFNSLNPCQISPHFLSFFHFSYSFVFFYCVTLQYTPSFTFLQAGPCCLSFTGFLASYFFHLSLFLLISLSLSLMHTHQHTHTHPPTRTHTHLPTHPHPLFLETDVVCQILSLLAN